MNRETLKASGEVTSASSQTGAWQYRGTEASAYQTSVRLAKVGECTVGEPRLSLSDLMKTRGGTEVVVRYRPDHVQTKSKAWFVEYDRILKEFSSLEEGWDSYGAAPPNRTAILLAKKIVRNLAKVGLRPSHVNPSVEEGVCISFRRGQVYADIESYNSGEIVAAICDGKEKDQIWEVDPTDQGIQQATRLIRERLGNCNH